MPDEVDGVGVAVNLQPIRINLRIAERHLDGRYLRGVFPGKKVCRAYRVYMFRSRPGFRATCEPTGEPTWLFKEYIAF